MNEARNRFDYDIAILADSGITFTTPGKPVEFLGMRIETTGSHFIPPVAERSPRPAQAPLGQPPHLLALSHYQRGDRRLERENPEHQIRRPRLSQLPQ